MKKYRVSVSWLLVCLMLLPMISAKGESCYVALRDLLSSEEQEELYIGKGISAPEEKSNEIWAVYNDKEELFFLVGVNDENQGEITVWQDVDMLQGYHVIYTLSAIWDTLQENMDKGYSIYLGIMEMEEVEDDWIIEDAESAELFVSVMEEVYASLNDE